MLFSADALADTVFDVTMCNVSNIITGNAGKAFAAFAIVSVGVGFFSGKISWGLMVGVSLGVSAIFGAPTIVAALSGKSLYECDAGVTYNLACNDGGCYSCPAGYGGATCTECATGYTGASCNQCDTGYKGTNCSECDVGYHKYNNKCGADCNVTGQNGVNDTTVHSGIGNLSCVLGNYNGNLGYICDDSSFSVTTPCGCIGNYDVSSSCASCTSGYSLVSGCTDCDSDYTKVSGKCEKDCNVVGVLGILDGSLALPINGSLSCSPSLGYYGSVNYKCENGTFDPLNSCNPYLESGCFEVLANTPLTMTAPPGKIWAGVKYAIFGRTSGCVLDSNPSVGCAYGGIGYQSMVSFAESVCVGQNSCTINSSMLGVDPCPGQPKKMNLILYY